MIYILSSYEKVNAKKHGDIKLTMKELSVDSYDGELIKEVLEDLKWSYIHDADRARWISDFIYELYELRL